MTLVVLEGVVRSETACALAELSTIVKKQVEEHSSQKFEISWFLFSPKPMLERWPLIVSKVINDYELLLV